MSGNNRYKEFEKLMTTVLIAAAVIFVLYLILSGIAWLKVLLAIGDLLLCLGGLAFLHLNRELTKPRSLWLSCGFFAILMCLLASLILNYPA